MDYLTIGVILLGLGAGAVVYLRRRVTPALGWQDKAALILTGYSERLRASAEEIEQPHADIFWDMAAHLERIRQEVVADARDLAQARRFIHHHAEIIVELVEKFVALHTKARVEHTARLTEMAVQVHGYRDVFARVEKALIDNDFADMEATMAALDKQIARLAF